MKVLLLVPQLPPTGRSTGRMALEYGKLLLGKGVEVTLLTATQRGAGSLRRIDGLGVLSAPELPFHAPTSFLQSTLDSYRLLKRVVFEDAVARESDVVVSMDWSTAVAGLALKRALRMPMIQVYNGAQAARASVTGKDLDWVGEMEAWSCQQGDVVVTPSDHMTAELRERFGEHASDVHCVPACASWGPSPVTVDREEFRRSLASPDELILLWVGSAKRRNGFDLLLGCLPEVLFSESRVRVVIAGESPEEAELQAGLKRAEGTGRIRSLGTVGDVVLEGLVQVSDILLAPSRYDPSGVGLWYAALRGLPVIATPGPAAQIAREQGCPVTIAQEAALGSAVLAHAKSNTVRVPVNAEPSAYQSSRAASCADRLFAALQTAIRRGKN